MVHKSELGDCSSKVPFTDRRNELGLIARAFEHYRNSTIERTQQLDRLQKENLASREQERARYSKPPGASSKRTSPLSSPL